MIRISTKDILTLILYAIPNTILSFGILYIINNVISGNDKFQTDYMGIVFVSIVIYTYLLNIIFQKWLNRYSYNILYENEKNIFAKMLNTPLITLEKFGSQRFYTAIEDLRIFSSLPDVITHTINSLLMLVLCMVYLFTLSAYSAMIVIALILCIAGIYFFVMRVMSQKVGTLRKYNEQYYKYVQDVIKGFKEFKINVHRRLTLMNSHLIPNREEAKELDFKVNFIFLSINLISQYGLYLIIGAILFLLPALGLLKTSEVLSYVVILLFITGPINNLINMQNIYTRLMVANRRIKKFQEDFKNEESEPVVNITTTGFNSLAFNKMTFEYKNETGEKIFGLGPLDLEITKGETIFIVGGNGSGKSTFINLLTGLYEPSNGKIELDAVPITSKLELQNIIAAVFTDNYIFSHNYDDFTLKANARYQEFLKIMEMDKVVINDEEESARKQFSKGQSKRMSLIFALLENKPILVLDEWAADQDPHFRKFFYEHLVPKFKKEGKTIIAVTHDDAYFKYADRVLKFDYGQIVKDIKVAKEMVHEKLW